MRKDFHISMATPPNKKKSVEKKNKKRGTPNIEILSNPKRESSLKRRLARKKMSKKDIYECVIYMLN